ncbi:MAG: hypothetical protein IAE86_06960 [Burkholderiaceae bacterium]|nr:hypothetical protein [Burkholderiaceae bacterium]
MIRSAARLALSLIAIVLAGIAVLAATATPAHAGYCKVSDAKYIHSGRVGADIWQYWWCEDGSWEWGAWRPSTATPERATASLAHAFGLNPGFPENAPKSIPDGDPAWPALRAAVQAAVDADTVRPSVASWIVQKNGSAADRPAYPFDGGGRGTKSTARVSIMTNGKPTPCDCSVKTVEGSTTYCGVAPQLVAVCVRAPDAPPVVTPPVVTPPVVTPPAATPPAATPPGLVPPAAAKTALAS